MNERLERIRAKSDLTDVAVDPVLPEADVQAFEHQHCIRLPEGYRQFLLHIGNGCVGPPVYGLNSLGSAPEGPPAKVEATFDGVPNVQKVFPFTQHWIWDDGGETAEGTEQDVDCGTIYLGTDGCGADWHLVVTGPDRGVPWMITGESIQPPCPKRDFLQWFEDWLDGKDSFYGWPGDQSALKPDVDAKKGTRTAYDKISTILWEKWDPLGVNADPSTRNSYARYAGDLYNLLTHRSFDIFMEDLLLDFETKVMGLNGSSDQHRFDVVKALREIDVTRYTG